ncbi:vacuolar ATP synthase subunit, putative, partial [Trypanosoma vivax Y486]
MSEDFLILGLPYLSRCQDTFASSQFKYLVSLMGPSGQALRHLVIPNFKVGTLDSLIEASDELARLDTHLEGIVNKQITLMEEISEKPRNVITILRINQTQEVTPATYMKNFQWNSSQFDSNESILGLVEKFSQISSSSEERMRAMLTEYNDTRNRLNTISRKSNGNLSVKPIRELVTSFEEKHGPFVNTEMLVTLFVAVPVASKKEWLENYWTLNDFVCPQSNQIIAEDSEFVLNSIVVFRRVMEDVKLMCRKKRYVIRECECADELTAGEMGNFVEKAEKERKNTEMKLWQQYGVCYVAWAHVKALRVFVESLLKFGLPPQYISLVLQVDEKKEMEIRKKLLQFYPELNKPLSNEPSLDN